MPMTPIDLCRPGAAHVDSFWAATAGEEVTGTPPLAGDVETDIAIIGAGYTGLSTAYHLAREYGIEALVLEANRVGWGCSGRNGGFCSTGMGKDGPRAWAERWGLEEARRIYGISRDAVATVAGILERERIDADRTPTGSLELAHRAGHLPEMEQRSRWLRDKLGVNARVIGKDELDRDYLVSREAYGALHIDEGFALHPMRYMRGLARATLANGVTVHGASPVIGWTRDGGRHLLRTPGGTVRARAVVVATNGYTNDALHPQLSGRLLPGLSNIVVTRPLTEAERVSVNWRTHLKMWDSRILLFYYRLLPDNRIMFGSRGGIEDTPASNAERRRWIKQRIADMFPPLAHVEDEYFWYGWVSVAYDKNPHFGTLPGDPTVHYALAYIGAGVALASHAGKLLARRIATGSAEYGKLLDVPLPRFPFPPLRRTWQRIAYAWYAWQDERGR